MEENKKILNKIKQKKIFKKVFAEDADLSRFNAEIANEYFRYYWDIYKNYKTRYRVENNKSINNSNNGAIFEAIFGFLLDKKEIIIHSYDEKYSNCEIVRPDFVLKKSNEEVIIFSLKTTLRERWKQADWEAQICKKEIFSNYDICDTYLLTADSEAEIRNINLKIHRHNLALKKVVQCFDDEFENLINSI